MIKNRRRWMKVIFAVYAAVVIGKLRQRRESALLALLETGNELPLKASVKI